MDEIAQLDAIGELHPVAHPVEAVRQDDLAFRARLHAGKVGGRRNPITIAEIELIGVRLGQGMRLPGSHGDILPDPTASGHVHGRNGASGSRGP